MCLVHGGPFDRSGVTGHRRDLTLIRWIEWHALVETAAVPVPAGCRQEHVPASECCKQVLLTSSRSLMCGKEFMA